MQSRLSAGDCPYRQPGLPGGHPGAQVGSEPHQNCTPMGSGDGGGIYRKPSVVPQPAAPRHMAPHNKSPNRYLIFDSLVAGQYPRKN